MRMACPKVSVQGLCSSSQVDRELGGPVGAGQIDPVLGNHEPARTNRIQVAGVGVLLQQLLKGVVGFDVVVGLKKALAGAKQGIFLQRRVGPTIRCAAIMVGRLQEPIGQILLTGCLGLLSQSIEFLGFAVKLPRDRAARPATGQLLDRGTDLGGGEIGQADRPAGLVVRRRLVIARQLHFGSLARMGRSRIRVRRPASAEYRTSRDQRAGHYRQAYDENSL